MNKTYTFEDMLDDQGHLVYTITGYSMYPFLRPGHDIIEIHAKKGERCKKYDVVLYKKGGKYILHRILKVLPEGYIIAGDNNAFLDHDVTDTNILGVMTKVIREDKEISTNHFGYKLYVHLWSDFYPVRFALLRMRNDIQRVRKKILRISCM